MLEFSEVDPDLWPALRTTLTLPVSVAEAESNSIIDDFVSRKARRVIMSQFVVNRSV